MNTALIPSSFTAKYIPAVSIHESTNPFDISPLEDLKSDISFASDPSKRRTRYQIIWIKKGKGIILINGQVHPIHDSIIYSIAPGITYKILEADNLPEGYYISFCPDFLQPSRVYEETGIIGFLEESFRPLFVTVPDHIHAELEMIAQKMKFEFRNSYNQKLEVLKGLLHIFIIYFSRNTIEKEEIKFYTRDQLLCKKFIKLIRKNYVSMKMVSDYANLLCVSPNYVNKIVKKNTGNTASYHIRQQIITEAKKLAVYYGSSLKEIAYHLGFDDLAHFSKFFKNNNGASFSCFRKGI